MKYSIKVASPENLVCDCLVLPVYSKNKLSDEAKSVDAAVGKTLSKTLRSGDFSATVGETLLLHALEGCKAKRVLLLGLGTRNKLDGKNAAKAVRMALKAALKTRSTSLHFALADVVPNDRDSQWLAARVAQEAEHASYQYDETKSKKATPRTLKAISLKPAKGGRKSTTEQALKRGAAIGKGMNCARQLGNLPGNICTPSYLAEQARDLAKKFKSIEVQILTEKQMRRLGMGSLLSVSAGSIEEAKLIVMRYQGGPKNSTPHVLVGKGITFDTGGISLKPGGAMDEMKYDMCGAASVFGSMNAIAEMKLALNVVGIVAAAENMPSDRATKPGDIVTSMAGKTIEILNTDAEGRLVLCDALTYAERFDPKSVIDIATLTGAAVATFGSQLTALMSNDQKLTRNLLDSGLQCLDPAWELPLLDEYQSLLNSNFADIANIGGPRAGTITAGCFLSRFTKKFKWAHLDIAGSAWLSGANKGATGRPVPLLVEYLMQQKP